MSSFPAPKRRPSRIAIRASARDVAQGVSRRTTQRPRARSDHRADRRARRSMAAPPMPARSSSCAFSRQAGHRAIVVSRAGRLVADVTAAGGEFVPLDVASNNPIVMLRNAAVLIRLARERQCDVDPCARPRRRLERLYRRAAARHSVRDQLVQGLSRAEHLQAPVQRHHGARRPRHRGERADRAIDQRPLRHAVGKDRGRAVQHRLRALRPGGGHARARRGDAPRLGRQARHQGDPDHRPHSAPQGPSRGGARRCAGSRTWG